MNSYSDEMKKLAAISAPAMRMVLKRHKLNDALIQSGISHYNKSNVDVAKKLITKGVTPEIAFGTHVRRTEAPAYLRRKK